MIETEEEAVKDNLVFMRPDIEKNAMGTTYWPRDSLEAVANTIMNVQPQGKEVVYSYVLKQDTRGPVHSVIIKKAGIVLFTTTKMKLESQIFIEWYNRNILAFKNLSAHGIEVTLVGKMEATVSGHSFACYYILEENGKRILLDSETMKQKLVHAVSEVRFVPVQTLIRVRVNSSLRKSFSADMANAKKEFPLFKTRGAVGFPYTTITPFEVPQTDLDAKTVLLSEFVTTKYHMNMLAFHDNGKVKKATL